MKWYEFTGIVAIIGILGIFVILGTNPGEPTRTMISDSHIHYSQPTTVDEYMTSKTYDPEKYGKVFTDTGPLVYRTITDDESVEIGTPVLNYVNCIRYANWLTEFQKEEIHFPEDYPRYPPWGNQIFPLVDHCNTTGHFVKNTVNGIEWDFVPVSDEYLAMFARDAPPHPKLTEDNVTDTKTELKLVKETYDPTSPDEVIKSMTLHDVPYQELIENEQEYIGKILYYHGKISNSNERHSSAYAIKIAKIAVTPGAGWVDFIELSYNGLTLKEDSFKKVWGLYNGINDETGLPMFQVFIIE